MTKSPFDGKNHHEKSHSPNICSFVYIGDKPQFVHFYRTTKVQKTFLYIYYTNIYHISIDILYLDLELDLRKVLLLLVAPSLPRSSF